MTAKAVKHAILGTLMPVQGPFATYMSEKDDYDLGLYIDGPVWLVKLDLDYLSYLTGNLETVEKEFALDVKYMEAFGRGSFTNRFEALFDAIVRDQLSYINFETLIDIRNNIATLMEEAYARLDRGETP